MIIESNGILNISLYIIFRPKPFCLSPVVKVALRGLLNTVESIINLSVTQPLL